MVMLIKCESSLLVEQDDTLGRVLTKAGLRHSIISQMAIHTDSSHVLVKLMRGVTHVWIPESTTTISENIDNTNFFVMIPKA